MGIKKPKPNHNKPLSDFQPHIDLLKSNGYNPIAVTQMFMENTFVFETDKEANKAYVQFEQNHKNDNLIVGWWYGRESFKQAVAEYESNNDGYSFVKIYWIDN